MLGEKVVQPGVQLQHAFAETLALLDTLVHHEPVALGAELALHGDEHALHRMPICVTLRDRMLGEQGFEIAQDDKAFLEDTAIGGLEDRQRRRAAGLSQQRFLPRFRDVDDLEAHIAPATLQRQQDLQPLTERADRDVVYGQAAQLRIHPLRIERKQQPFAPGVHVRFSNAKPAPSNSPLSTAPAMRHSVSTFFSGSPASRHASFSGQPCNWISSDCASLFSTCGWKIASPPGTLARNASRRPARSAGENFAKALPILRPRL